MSVELREVGSVSSASGATRRRITIISAGWGSSGYYSKEVLARCGPKAFKEGTLMYLDHPSRSEEINRPERSVKDLAGKICRTPWMEGNNLVSEAEIFPVWRETIDALADTIGLSIRATGDAEFGEAEGRQGQIVESLDDGLSVDFVTEAGRGGKVHELIESAHRKAEQRVSIFVEGEGWQTLDGQPVDLKETHKETSTVNDAEKIAALEARVAELNRTLEEARTELSRETARADRSEDALTRIGAERVVREAVEAIEGLPERAYDRAVQAAMRDKLPLIEGTSKVDLERLKERGRKAAEDERDYLLESTGGNGRVTGLGGGTTFTETDTDRDTNDALVESFKGLGLDEEAAKIAAGGR
jgi:hypothetical protein